MIRRDVAAAAVFVVLLLAAARDVAAAPCPDSGGTLDIVLETAAGATPSTVLAFGTLADASCEPATEALRGGYAVRLECDPASPASCHAAVEGLQPGRWMHRLLVTLGEATGQFQGRTGLVLDASAGTQVIEWPIYRSVHTVLGLGDSVDCSGCLRSVLAAAEAGTKPALVQFVPDVLGSVVLVAPLAPLAAGQVTIDGTDTDGQPLTRTVDANGLNAAALRIVSARNHVIGLRVVNSGGDSDALLVDGPAANGNVLETLEVVGRAVEPCMVGETVGCVLNGTCRVASTQSPRGECGDDSVAVRDSAGAIDPNVIRDSVIRGALDKGIKVSDGGAALIEHCTVTGNTDGGIQATLSGQVTAVENLVHGNRGTNSANGLAANGASAGGVQPALLDTHGNLSMDNALRGISVRSLSIATLHDDFACGNGTVGRGSGYGLAVLDAAGRSALTTASGLAVVHNLDGGVVIDEGSAASFGSPNAPGQNAFAFNGSEPSATPANFRSSSSQSMPAIGNQWEHCGMGVPCDLAAVEQFDVFTATADAPVLVAPAQATRRRALPAITAVVPTYAAAGDLVRIYGSGFDAIDGAGTTATTCATLGDANGCHPMRGNCVFIGQQPAQVVAATPTMLVVRAPFTCVAPVSVRLRTRWSRGFARATFCTLPAPGN